MLTPRNPQYGGTLGYLVATAANVQLGAPGYVLFMLNFALTGLVAIFFSAPKKWQQT